MSASLLRKGLELLGAGEEVRGKASLFTKKGKKSSVKDAPKLKSRKTGVKKRPLQQKAASVRGRVIKSAIEEYRKHQQKNQLESNLKYMLGTTFIPDRKVTQQILNQNQGRKSRDRPAEKEKKKQEEKSIFSESDFLRFQREYFGGGVGGI